MRSLFRRSLVSGAAGFVATLATVAAPAAAAVICVPNIGIDGSCTGSAGTINAGIAAAAGGDTVLVDDGTYVEFVVIDRNVALLSLNGRAVTTIDPPSTPTATLGTIRVTNATTGAQIGGPGQGFTVHGIDNLSPGLESAAIYFQGSHSDAQVIDNEIVAAGDAGLQTEFGATISGFVVSGNTFSGQTFTGANPADSGFANQFTTPNVPRQLVTIGCGGGCLNTSNTTFTNNLVTGTAGGCNAGGLEQGNTLVTIDSNGATITGNDFSGTTSRFATSLRARGASTTISGNTFDSSGLVASCPTPIVPPATGHVFVQNTGETVGTVAGQNTFDKGVYVDVAVGTIGLTVRGAVAAVAPGTTINVLPGAYTENVVVNKNVTLKGSQQGVAGCGRVATESTISDASGGTTPVITLQTGAAGAVIDGFTISGGTRGIESTSGPLDNLQLRNNRVLGFTGAGVFLNDPGLDLTVHQNEIDGTTKAGGGGLFHLDQDNFDGFHFTSNCVVNGATATGFFVDGNHSVGASVNRAPLIDGNLLLANQTGMNLGRFAFEFGTISNNTFQGNAFDGLQGGIQNTAITDNNFDGNGRFGLALTGFGGAGDATRGAQNDTVTDNCFTGNGFVNAGGALSFSATQFPGTISTNEVHQNNIAGNAAGALYTGGETIDAENNWWGCPTGANTGTCDTAAANVDATPFLGGPSVSAPCGCTTDAQCNDGLACTGGETCSAGACVAGTPVDCSGLDDQCNVGTCNEPLGTCSPVPVADGTGCDDGYACSLPDACQAGVCEAGGVGDGDVDTVCDPDDNCPADANADQADLDGDDVGNVCDPDDGPMNVTAVDLKRSNNLARPNGVVGLKGDVILDPSQNFLATPKITFTVTDSKPGTPFSLAQTWTVASECKIKGTRITCSTADKRFKATFRPFPKTPSVYRFAARFRKLATATDLVFEGPVTVVLTFGPPPPASGQYDQTSVISDCRATASGIKCRQF